MKPINLIFRRLTLLPTLAFLLLAANTTHAASLSLDDLDWQAVAPDKLGMNVNYLLDGAIPEAQLKNELRAIGAQWLRFPGGEKSDNHLWSVPPYEVPAPRAALTGMWNWPTGDERFFSERDGISWSVDPLDFDEFMRLCQSIDAEPIIVVAQEAAFKPKDERHGQISEETLIEAAVAWVRYSRSKGYNVRYWEIGNEAYLQGSQTPQAFARSWTRFARAMKAEDPDIRVGVNGPNGMGTRDQAQLDAGPWWPAFIENAGLAPDWISLHDYPCYQWMGYEHYTEHPVEAVTEVDGLQEALNKRFERPAGTHTPVLITEVNSADWYGHPEQLGWSHDSSIGHGLVLFDILGQNLINPKIEAVLPWNTRWLNNETAPQLWDAFDASGQPLPTGRAIAIWHDFYPEEVAVVPSDAALRIYAGRGGRAGEGTLFMINKTLQPERIDLQQAAQQTLQWSGTSPDDAQPIYQAIPNTRTHTLPPHSLIVLNELKLSDKALAE